MERFKNLPIVKKLGFNRIVLIGVIIMICALFPVLAICQRADSAGLWRIIVL